MNNISEYIIAFFSGLIISIPFLFVYSLIDYINKLEEDIVDCATCDFRDKCIGNKRFSIGDSKWLFEFTGTCFILLYNRCRYICRVSSVKPIIFMIFNGIVYIFIYCVIGITPMSIIYCLCATTLIYLSVVDWNTQYIPFEFNIFIFILGLINLFININNWLEYVIGLFAVSGFLWLVNFVGIRLTEHDTVIGGGDIKLMAAAGLLLGWKLNLLALMIGCILGAVIHLVIMAIKKGDHVLAFGPYLSMGIFIAMIWGQQLVSWYLSMAGLDKLAY